MDLQRRLTLYLFGLLIGGGLAYWIYGKRLANGGWLPEEKLKQRFRSTLLKASPAAEAQLAEWGTDLTTLRQALDTTASIDFSASRRTDDSMFYAVQATVNGHRADLEVATLRDFDRDSTATLSSVRAAR